MQQPHKRTEVELAARRVLPTPHSVAVGMSVSKFSEANEAPAIRGDCSSEDGRVGVRYSEATGGLTRGTGGD